MRDLKLCLTVLPEPMAICKLAPTASVAEWASAGKFLSITWTTSELSIVCPAAQVPDGITHVRGWRCIKVEDPLDFSQTGVLAALALPLAHAEVSIFALSTYDSDYVLVHGDSLEKAIFALTQAGHRFHER
jgi:hypothetical protein